MKKELRILRKAAVLAGILAFALMIQVGISPVWGVSASAGTAGEGGFRDFVEAAGRLLGIEPEEVRLLRQQEVPMTDEGHQEYYFQQLDGEEQRCYRQMLEGIRNREEEFYVTVADDEKVDKVYRAVLKDHPELFWVHNRESFYKTVYGDAGYCLFAPGYSYTEEEIAEITAAMEQGYQELVSLLPEGAGDYQKAEAAYTYLIDTVDYVESEHDQSIAGAFWKKQAVCAGYAGAFQYLMERLQVPCIYVDGDARGSTKGHAWNIITLDGSYYYVDVTNGDQPEFLEGDAVQLAEHKTTIMDYLCPFPWEYEANYTASQEFVLPECTATDENFYVRNQGCFDTYDWQSIYDYCRMRLDNGAAVVRFKFSNEEAYSQAYREWVEGDSAQQAAQYYLSLYGMNEVEYHYGVLPDLMTIYYMF